MKTIEQQLHDLQQKSEELDRQLDKLEVRFAELSGAIRDLVTAVKVNPEICGVEQDERTFRLYEGAYVHVESLTGDTVIVDGVKYLLMSTRPNDYRRVGLHTQIVHLVDYERIDEYGEVECEEDGWNVSNGTCFVISSENKSPLKLISGTKYKVLYCSDFRSSGVVYPGTLAIRYPDFNYPAL